MYGSYKSKKITCWNKKDTLIDPYIFGFWLGIIDKELSKSYLIKQNISSYLLIENICFENKRIPYHYKINDYNFRIELLCGIIDSCGNVTNDNLNYILKINKNIKDDINFIIRSLGFNSRKPFKYCYDKYKEEDEYTEIVIFGSELYSIPIRSNKILIKNKKLNLDNSINITKLDKNKYYGFELNDNGRFLLGDFTVTHNTSTILSFVYELYGPNIFDKRVIELNASDERGINVVRNKIITFAKTAIGNTDPNYPCPPYKIVILDEADAMTTEAQSALRTVMESLSKITRFCFICNYVNQILDPISSRCMKFRFKPINNNIMMEKLRDIANKENFLIPINVIEKIIDLSKGDIRRAIMTLQYLKYIYDYQETISIKDIYTTTNYLPDNIIKNLFKKCIISNKFTVMNVKKETQLLKRKGYSVHSIINQLNKIIIKDKILNDNQKSLICFNLAKTERRLINGSDEYIQLLNIFAYIQKIYNQ